MCGKGGTARPNRIQSIRTQYEPPKFSVPSFGHILVCNLGKAKSQRDRSTLHQPIRLRPQRCIQRCISQKAEYNFLGPVPPHPTTAQHTGPNTHSNTQHTRARSRRTCRRLMSSLKVGVRSLERVWWMLLQSWRQRQQQ